MAKHFHHYYFGSPDTDLYCTAYPEFRFLYMLMVTLGPPGGENGFVHADYSA